MPAADISSQQQRLLPATLFAVFIIACSVYVSEAYVPPTQTHRVLGDIPPTIATLVVLGIAMAMITCAWHVPKFWKVLNTYMLNVPALPHPISMLGNIFSHQNFKHLIVNSTWLWLFGIACKRTEMQMSLPAADDLDSTRGYRTRQLHGALLRRRRRWFSDVSVLSRPQREFWSNNEWGQWSRNSISVCLGLLQRNVSLRPDLLGATFGSHYSHSNPEGPLAASTSFLQILKLFGYTFVLSQIPMHFAPGVGLRIDVWSHAGGAVVGLVGAIALKARLESKKRQQRAAKNTIIKARH